ncbi:MAG: hypothetical protein QXO30_04010 [Candidatus Caldarchaeum sp.]
MLDRTIAGGGPTFYTNLSCTPIQPGHYARIAGSLVNPKQRFTIVGRAINNKILTLAIP